MIFLFSADTKFDTTFYASLLRDGIINAMRESSLRMFIFDADMIIHESGVPPIHTDASELDALPVSIKVLSINFRKISDTV